MLVLKHPQFDPVAIDLSAIGLPIAVHWYGLTYLVAFALFLWLARVRVARPPFVDTGWTKRDVEDLLFYGVLGVVIGGRLGYVLFYKPGYYAAHPLEAFAVWKGGMAFHGGLLGAIAAMMLFAKLRHRTWLQVTDLVAPCVPTGLAAGRIGNFINGELWGRPADPNLPWAMVFPAVGQRCAAPPVAAVPVCPRRAAAVRRALALCAQAAADWAGVGSVPDRLRRAALRRGVLS